MDKDEALWVESKLSLDSNSEFMLISLINMTHPSLEEALDKTNLRDTNPWEILDNKTSNECYRYGMMETKFSPMDYIMNISSNNSCSYEKSPKLIGISTTTHEIFKPLILSIPKDFERMVVDTYVYHKYCRSHCVNLEIGTR
jgi:hypothetical protein